MTTDSSILAWEIPWTEEPGWARVHGLARVRHDLETKPPPYTHTHTHTHTHTRLAFLLVGTSFLCVA